MNKIFFILFISLFLNISNSFSKDYMIYYFMTDYRCSSCYKIEKYTREVFDEMNHKNIDFQVINIDEKENKHFIKDFNLYTKSVFLFKNDGTFKNLDKVWVYLKDEMKFKDYLKAEIAKFME